MNALRQAVAELVAAEPTAHLEIDEIADYHSGGLDADAEARARRHLVACAECTALLVDLERLATGELGENGTSEIELVHAWRRLSRRLAETETKPARPGLGSARLPWAIAASFLAAALGLSLWVMNLQGTVAELTRPQLNMPIEDLLPGKLRSDFGGLTTLVLRPDDRLFTLVLNPAWSEGQENYDIVISQTGGEVVWRGSGLRRNDLGSLNVTLSRRFLAGGEYRIKLYPRGSTDPAPTAEFTLRIEDQPAED